MSDEDDFEAKRRAQEYLILLVLGAVPDKKLSMLHLEKEVFLLWNFHPSIPKFIQFVAYQRGPYAESIRDSIISPYYLTEAWEYLRPRSAGDLTGGFVRLTIKGKRTYQAYYQTVFQQEKMRPLLAGIRIVRTIYDDLTPEELLLLIYDAYPEFRIKSEVAKEIDNKREKLTAQLLRRGKVTTEKAAELRQASWYA